MLEPGFVKLTFGAALLATLAIVCAVRAEKRGTGRLGSKAKDEHFHGFQRTYLLVYLPAMMADWLQGPYVYALYQSYGFSQGDNAVLFTAGFAASAVFGTVIGSLADKMGRRKFAALFCLLYGASCLTKHVNSFSCLLVGRITGGIATSLLFSVFDSWMVSEHNARGFDAELLGSTFSLAVFSNSIVAIAAGEVGQMAADMVELTHLGGGVHYGGYCSPFDAAIVCLVVSLLGLSALWPENYGQKSTSASSNSLISNLCLALRTIQTQPQVLYCGVVCAFFEASMFIFVFMWTPALTEEGAEKPPYGHIFAAFMVMSMMGSQLFSIQLGQRSVEEIGQVVLVASALCHVAPVFTSDATLRYCSFLLFELCVGMYFPMMGTLKGSVVPEEMRSAIYNIFRLPLNIIVVGALALKIEMEAAFAMTTGLLLTAGFFQKRLISCRHSGCGPGPYRPVGADTEFGLDDEMPLGDLEGPGSKNSEELATIMGNRS